MYEGGKAKEYFAEAYFSKSQMENDLIKDRWNYIDYDWVWITLRETEKLIVCYMVWHFTGKKQLVLLKKFRTLVFIELHIKTEHSGTIQYDSDRCFIKIAI